MKKLILILSILFTVNVAAQTQTRDVVYLKNGSIIKGQIKEMNPTESLKIETGDGSLFVYKMTEILKMEKETFAGVATNENKTQPNVNIAILSNYFKSYFSQKNRNALKFIDVSKKNGVKKIIDGQQKYIIEYELILETVKDIYVSDIMSVNTNGFSKTFGYFLNQPKGWNAYMNADTKKINSGQRIIANGNINLEETDNGWRVTGFNNSNYKTVSSNFVSKSMLAKNKQKLQNIKSLGDWKKDDDSEYKKMDAFYLESKDVPVFENAITKFDIKKSYSCSDCRNDNLNAINNGIKQALKDINRYSESNAKNFNESENNADFTITITNINFKHRGLDGQGKDKGYFCEIRYAINIDVNLNNPQPLNFKSETKSIADSNVFYFRKDKNDAFEAALEKLKSKLQEYIIKAEPLALNVISIQLDKKGNPEYIVFSNANKNISKTDKLDFMIVEKSTFSLNNNGYSIGKNFGTVTYDQSKYPTMVICEIKKSKMKKALIPYINNLEALLGVSK